MSFLTTHTFVAGIIIMLASLAGIIFVSSALSKWLRQNLHYLITLSATVFLLVSINLAQEAIGFSSFSVGIFYVALGIILFYFGSKIFPEVHHHEHEDCDEDHGKEGAIRMMIGDGIHNIGDGILLVPAFAISLEAGIGITIAVFVHEFIQEISEYFILREAGYSSAKALFLNFLVSSTILVGILIGLLATSISDTLLAPLLGVAAGGFLFIVFKDLFPKSVRSSIKEHSYKKHLLWGLIGVLIILGVNQLLPEEHLDTEKEVIEEIIDMN